MIVLHETEGGKVLNIRAVGKLIREDYEALIPRLEQLVQTLGIVRILFEMKDFQGWNAGAVWQDIRFDVRHFSGIERIALVGDRKWEKGMSIFCEPFTTAKVKYFDVNEVDKAKKWVKEGIQFSHSHMAE
jgi:hypothetical protein